MSAKIWVICDDGILCDDQGVPFVITMNVAPMQAVHLGFAETHDGQSMAMPSDDSLPATHAISCDDAIALGLLNAYGQAYDAKDAKNLRTRSFREFINTSATAILNLMSRAIMLIRWHQDHRFCSRCGTQTVLHSGGEHTKICPACRHRAYPRVQPCVIIAITRRHPDTQKRQILLARHHRHKSGVHGLIAGFVEAGETLEMAVHREALEEVGVGIDHLRYFGSQSWPYPSNLMTGFIAAHAYGDIKIQPNELASASFFDIDALPSIPSPGTIAHALIQAVVNEGKLIQAVVNEGNKA